MFEWENYLDAYIIKIERTKAEKGHRLTLLLADIPVDDLECQEDDDS